MYPNGNAVDFRFVLFSLPVNNQPPCIWRLHAIIRTMAGWWLWADRMIMMSRIMLKIVIRFVRKMFNFRLFSGEIDGRFLEKSKSFQKISFLCGFLMDSAKEHLSKWLINDFLLSKKYTNTFSMLRNALRTRITSSSYSYFNIKSRLQRLFTVKCVGRAFFQRCYQIFHYIPGWKRKESRNEYDFGFELCSKHWALFGMGFVRRNMPIAHAPAYVHLHQTNPIHLD